MINLKSVADFIICFYFLQPLNGTLVSSTKQTDRHDIPEILLKVALNTITLHREKQMFKENIKYSYKNILDGYGINFQ